MPHNSCEGCSLVALLLHVLSWSSSLKLMSCFRHQMAKGQQGQLNAPNLSV
uniref:Uncharacterized protein n=1 Tax=Anguilla anguilla TaxID=7936 RepID=A0A0E9S5Z4_ANGAN